MAVVACATLVAAQTPGRAGAAARPAASTRTGPPMPPALVARLIALGKERSDFPDVSRRSGARGGDTILVVSSNRQVIVRESAKALASGADYMPAAELRRDEVTVTCVDTRSRGFVDCERVVVLDSRDRAIPPLRTSSGPHTLHNNDGAAWDVGGAEAIYAASLLRNGFVVTGLARNGTSSWTLVVTAEDAVERLLLGSTPGATTP